MRVPNTLAERLLAGEALCWLAVVEMAFAVLPEGRFLRLLRVADTDAQRPPDDVETARRVSRAVETAARYVPWKPSCFTVSVAAGAILWTRGVASTLHIGVALRGRRLHAHAWLESGPMHVTDEATDGFQPLCSLRFPAR